MSTIENTPKSNRIHIGFFGPCNAGKSTLINMLTDQEVSLVASVAGTTTDPVSKAMEILPLGPVMITDTAGIDDTSELGALRIKKTKTLLPTINIAVYVVRNDVPISELDIEWIHLLSSHHVPIVLCVNQVDPSLSTDKYLASYPMIKEQVKAIGSANFLEKDQRLALLDMLGHIQPIDGEEEATLLEGIIEVGDIVVLVCPIDSAAPKGRLILPQVQMIREILNKRGLAVVVQTEELAQTLDSLSKEPRLVITDSQAFEEVSQIVPLHIPLTSFSILMARFKGRLKELVKGIHAVKQLQPGSKVLISEGCTHRRQCDDIGTVKIPKWLEKQGYKDLDLHWSSGGHFPEDIETYDLIIHCGACMLTRREVLHRIDISTIHGVPIVNYGILIAELHGILERAISPFCNEL